MASLEDLQQKIERLKQEARRIEQRAKDEALETIAALMIEHDIHIAVVQTYVNATRKRAAPKYRDPVTGKTWAGRGAVPKWLREKEAAGRSRDDFEIANA